MRCVQGRTEVTEEECPCCGGACQAELITLTLRCANGSFAVVRNVPAEVCQNCGEAQFSLVTTAQLLAALQMDRQPDEVVMVPIYDLS